MGGRQICSRAGDQPGDGSKAPEPCTAPQGCLEKSQAYQAGREISRQVLRDREVLVGFELAQPVTVSIVGRHDRPVSVAQCLISIVVPVMRVGLLRCLGRATCGIRPVVRSAGSGSATRIPAMSRPSTAALTATRASSSAVAAPAETPSTVDVVRIVAA